MANNNDDSKLDNMTVRRFAKLLKNNNSGNASSIASGTVVQNDNELYVAIDDETLVPIEDTTSSVSVGDKVTIGIGDDVAYILGNNTDKSVTSSNFTTNLSKTEKGFKLELADKASKNELTLETDKLQSSITNTKEELNSTITQTAEGLTVNINNAQSTADTAKANAAKAQTSADDARKVATNYLSFTSADGLVVGDMTSSTLKGNTQITSVGVNVRNGTTKLASFNAKDSFIGYQDGSSTAPYGDEASLSFMKNKNGDSAIKITTYPEEDWGGGRYIGDIYSKFFLSLVTESGSVSAGSAAGIISEGVIPDASIVSKNSGASIYVGTTDTGSKSGILLTAEKIYKLEKTLGEIYGETVLYNNTSGTKGTVTLSQSAANFTYLEIFFLGLSQYGSVKVYSPNNKSVGLSQNGWASGTTTSQRNFETIKISGTSITRGTMGINQVVDGYISQQTRTTSDFLITRVVGIK